MQRLLLSDIKITQEQLSWIYVVVIVVLCVMQTIFGCPIGQFYAQGLGYSIIALYPWIHDLGTKNPSTLALWPESLL